MVNGNLRFSPQRNKVWFGKLWGNVMRKLITLVAVTALSVPASVHAATIVQFSNAAQGVFGEFQAFDTSLGTLNSVKLGIAGYGAGSATWNAEPGGPNEQLIDFFVGGTGTFFGSGFSESIQAFGSAAHLVSDGNETFFDVPLGASIEFTDLSNFTGTQLGYSFETFAYFLAPPSGMLTNGGSDSVGSLTLTYDYTIAAVPEPATWAMMLIGFGAVGAAMRAKRRQMNVSVAYA